jgi:hypothetical protein
MHRFQGADALRERLRNGATALRAQFATTTKEEEKPRNRQPAPTATAAASPQAAAAPAATPAVARAPRARRAAWLDDAVAVTMMLVTFTLFYYILPTLPLVLAAHVRAREEVGCVRVLPCGAPALTRAPCVLPLDACACALRCNPAVTRARARVCVCAGRPRQPGAAAAVGVGRLAGAARVGARQRAAPGAAALVDVAHMETLFRVRFCFFACTHTARLPPSTHTR